MTITSISWYLCVLFAVALAVCSAITVAPGGQAMVRVEIVSWLLLSLVFAVVAVLFKRLRLPQPKWLLRVFQCIAVLATVLVLMMIGG